MRTEVKKWAGCVGLMGAIALGGPAYADFPIGSRWVEYLGSNEGGADWGKTARFDSSAANRIDTYMPEGKDVVVDFL